MSSDPQLLAEEIEFKTKPLQGSWAILVSVVALSWCLFQLWIASPLPFSLGWGILIDVPKRAIHLAFAMCLCFLLYGARESHRRRNYVAKWDLLLAVLAVIVTLYVPLAYASIVERHGMLLNVTWVGINWPVEMIIGVVGVALLLEATRRALGLPLVIVSSVFLIYSIFGQSMPELISHKGVSLERLVGYHWLGGEAIFGIPLDVSVSFVFLFVLFGALLERAGAGKYFLDLAFAMVGRYRGGPAKASILASAMTGTISGSSIANVVTTGTFTIPVMRKMGMPAVKAGAIEVAASTNGQLMPPIMGAAAFIMAEYIGISYMEVVKAAIVPALISYIALLYISHLEALKLDLKGIPRADIPHLWRTFIGGLHYLLPIVVLIYLLMVKRWTPGSAVFYSILLLMGMILVQNFWRPKQADDSILGRFKAGVADVIQGMVSGTRNMITIGVAVATAGIIVGAVSSTGLNNAMVGLVEAIAGNNIYLLLGLTALLCLVLGIGLPTTANYLVVASLMAGVLVELGSAAGLALPIIAVHLFVFYFGLLADDTPPVCLAAYAASAISRADPIKTGIQAFAYDIRTAILPFVFIFNPQLLLIGVTSWWHGISVFLVALVAILSFSSATQGWLLIRNRWYESLVLLFATWILFLPNAAMNRIFPEYEAVKFDTFTQGQLVLTKGQQVRLHVTRHTNYGDRFKLFVFPVDVVGAFSAEDLGMSLAYEDQEGWFVQNLSYQSPAEAVGIDYYDAVTAIDVQALDRPPREWAFIPAFLLIALVLLNQRRRSTRVIDGELNA
ncbi:MAG: TRAP transporter 4TM/12TM fusion protein [Oceanospirillaceae bacterium]|jgi:TRAP transporter 4TM/12TM fusion protein